MRYCFSRVPNDQCGHLLRLDSSKPKGQALVGRSLWEWMDVQDKAVVVAAMGVCLFLQGRDETGALHPLQPRLPFRAAAPRGDAAAPGPTALPTTTVRDREGRSDVSFKWAGRGRFHATGQDGEGVVTTYSV
jgi:hypothetical protein